MDSQQCKMSITTKILIGLLIIIILCTCCLCIFSINGMNKQYNTIFKENEELKKKSCPECKMPVIIDVTKAGGEYQV